MLDACPGWFALAYRSWATATGIARVEVNASEGDIQVALVIGIDPSGVRVREAEPGSRFPKSCPERHIEGGGTFCIGLDSGHSVVDETTARRWWEALLGFLRAQRTAGRIGVWPEHNALSHGDAGFYHLRALEIASQLGFEEHYEAHLIGTRSPMDGLVAQLRRDGRALLNGRAPCACGCRDRRGRPFLRRNCPRRELVLMFLRYERRRAAEVERYWDRLRRSGAECCGTMHDCPLAGGPPLHASRGRYACGCRRPHR